MSIMQVFSRDFNWTSSANSEHRKTTTSSKRKTQSTYAKMVLVFLPAFRNHREHHHGYHGPLSLSHPPPLSTLSTDDCPPCSKQDGSSADIRSCWGTFTLHIPHIYRKKVHYPKGDVLGLGRSSEFSRVVMCSTRK